MLVAYFLFVKINIFDKKLHFQNEKYKEKIKRQSIVVKHLYTGRYVQVECLGEKQIVPVYMYVCYASNLDLDTTQLHEVYKQRSTCEPG